jgi:hypothetical protein
MVYRFAAKLVYRKGSALLSCPMRKKAKMRVCARKMPGIHPSIALG